MDETIINSAKKEYDVPSHSAEHLLNQTMIRMFNCGRAVMAHIEQKKSKCDYALPQELTKLQLEEIETRMNEVIAKDLPVTYEFMTQEEARDKFNLSKLPDDATEMLRIVRIGDYDACPCIGTHVKSTAEIGTFKITTATYENGVMRLRWKLSRK